MIDNNRRSILVGNASDDPFGNAYQDVINNEFTVRSKMLNSALHSRKDINEECDYPETGEITVTNYRQMYDRSPIAARVVEVLPSECWQTSPIVFEDEDAEVTTEFEAAWEELGKSFLGEQSWFDTSEQSNPIWERLFRVDKLSGIGHYGLILLGIDDGKELRDPVDGFNDPQPEDKQPASVFVNNEEHKHKLIFLSVFDESCVDSVTYETNQHSPRYRKPKTYTINLGGGSEENNSSQTPPGGSITVHWSRIIHVADNMNDSEITGVPRQRPVWNNLLDLLKIYGGDAEGWWKNCVMRIFLETHPTLGGDVEIDIDSVREDMWNMENGLQRWMATMGLNAKTVAPAVVDPSAHITVQIEAICIKIPIPKRVFMGTERGELASGQDDSTWNDTVRGRQTLYLIPRLIVPFIDRLIQIGVLPEPKQYKVKWPDPETAKPLEVAELALKRMETMVKYLAGGVSQLMDPMDFLMKEMGLEEDEAKTVLKNALEFVEDEDEKKAKEEAKLLEEQAKLGVAPGSTEVETIQLPGTTVGDAGEPIGNFTTLSKEDWIGNELDDVGDGEFIEQVLNVPSHTQSTHGRRGSKAKGGGKLGKSAVASVLAKGGSKAESDKAGRDAAAKGERGKSKGDEDKKTKEKSTTGGKMNDLEQRSINAWVAGASTQIRAKEASGKSDKNMEAFQSALDKFPKHDGTVHRGMTVDSSKLKEFSSMKPGTVIKQNASSSTSTSNSEAKRFADPKGIFSSGDKSVMFSIKSKTGADITSFNKGQSEVVLRKGTSYKVTKVVTGGGVDVTVHMEEV